MLARCREMWRRFNLRLLDWISIFGGRLFMPKIAAKTDAEHSSGVFHSEETDLPAHLLIEDHGADTTVFSFSSAAFLHAGLPTFEFRGFLQRQPQPLNLVFVRDVHRLAYHLTPAGEPNGLEFYEEAVREALARLPSSRNIGIGDSSGASAALYFGSRCGFDKVIGFTNPFPLDAWLSWPVRLHAILNCRELLRDRGAYWDVLVTVWFGALVAHNLRLNVGKDGIFDPIATYLGASPRPLLSLYHGARCRADSIIADRLRAAPEATIHPVPTGRHNLWVPLARMGGVEKLIADEMNLDSPPS